jgi:hypothetical protein
MSRGALCKEIDVRREAQRVAKATGQPCNDADIPYRRTFGPILLFELATQRGRGQVEYSDSFPSPSREAASAFSP